MKEELFEELVKSVRQGGAIIRAERKPSRVFLVGKPDARKIRECYGLSQEKFARLTGISVKAGSNLDK